MIIQGDNLIMGGQTVDATKLDNHDLITVTAEGNVGLGTSTPTMPWSNHKGLHIHTVGGASDIRLTREINGAIDADYVIRADDPDNKFVIRNQISGTHPFIINGNGYITTSNQPAFSAHGPNIVGQGQYVVYASARSNIGNHYNTTTGTFTAPITGHYHFTFNALMRGDTSQPYVRLWFDINGVHNATYGDTLAGGATTAWDGWNYISVTNSITIYLNANDTVRVWNDGPHSTYGPSYGTFSGFLVG